MSQIKSWTNASRTIVSGRAAAVAGVRSVGVVDAPSVCRESLEIERETHSQEQTRDFDVTKHMH